MPGLLGPDPPHGDAATTEGAMGVFEFDLISFALTFVKKRSGLPFGQP
ncbi:MAG: hypothetical protein P8X95_27905 [Anaerolineales bacterium]|jgi:hypothetical protein